MDKITNYVLENWTYNCTDHPHYDFIRTILRENEPSIFEVFYKRIVYKLKHCFQEMKDWMKQYYR